MILNSDSARFFDALFCEYGQTQLTAELVVLKPKSYSNGSSCIYRNWYALDSNGATSLSRDASVHSGRNDVYMSFLPRERGKGDSAAVSVAGWMYCGVDGERDGIEGAVGLVKHCVKWGHLPRPNMVVNSGHGLHCYWKLPELYSVDDQHNKEEFSGLLRRIGQAIGGKLPYCHSDPARIPSVPRLPGTFNHKDIDKPIQVKLISYQFNTPLWPIGMWQSRLPREHWKRNTVDVQKYGVGEMELLPSYLKAAALTPAAQGTRHKTFAALAAGASAAGLGVQAILLLGTLYCANNPGYTDREMRATANWAVRNIAPKAGKHG